MPEATTDPIISDQFDQQVLEVLVSNLPEGYSFESPAVPFQDEINQIWDLKNKKLYVEADQIAWGVLSCFGIEDFRFIQNTSIDHLIRLIPDHQQPALSWIVMELAKSCEVRAEIARADQDRSLPSISPMAVKLFLIASELDNRNAESIRRLADNCVRFNAEDFEAAQSSISFEANFLALEGKQANEALIELQTEALLRLLDSLEREPYNLTSEHLEGRAKFPQYQVQELVELTWTLGNAAKLSVLLASFHFYSADPPRKLDFAKSAFDCAGSVLELVGIPREVGPAIDAINRKSGQHNPYGTRKRTLAHALNSLGSASELHDEPQTAKKWYEAALRVDGSINFARTRLEAIQSHRGSARTVTRLLEAEFNKPARDVSASSSELVDWETEFSSRAPKFISPAVQGHIDNSKTILQLPNFQSGAYEFAKRFYVAFLEKRLGDKFLNHLEVISDTFWETSYEPDGNIELQYQISLLKILTERRIITLQDRAKELLEKLEGIRDASVDVAGVPGPAVFLPFCRDIADWVVNDKGTKAARDKLGY